ncbi:hypothetical protein BU16DRAFT_585234 [Lophium mytilinum]|uniref:DUF7730 domain-containing protein n=1 Tax=Lophium mytilinum TaxID=390894 RepID=A0A6A6QHG1_9PEZI|nr:hypothetical protein BU16DRAFT_585234 [Lophium mytilinum]
MHLTDIPRRLSKGLISPLIPLGPPPSHGYFPDGPSNPSVKPLPSRRKRALSLTCEENSDSDQVTFDQSQSPLYNKLPAEIRLLIWEAALGYSQIHVRPNPDDRKLEHMKCKDPSHSKQDCWRLFGWDRYTKLDFYDYGVPSLDGWSNVSPATEGLLALPLACRRIYSEAIPALYTLNTFSFAAFEPITAFSAAVLPHRFHSIQRLDIDVSFVFLKFDPTSSNWAGCNDKLIWERAWRVIASMKGLRELNVRLVDLCTSSNPMDLVSVLDADLEEDLWKPLKAVTRPKRFVVETSLGKNDSVELGDAPFTVVRLGEKRFELE